MARSAAGSVQVGHRAPGTACDPGGAEARTREIRDGLAATDRFIVESLLLGDPPAMVAGGLAAWMRQIERDANGDEECLRPIREVLYGPRVDAVLAWPHGGFYADDVASMDHELRAVLDAQRAGDPP